MSGNPADGEEKLRKALAEALAHSDYCLPWSVADRLAADLLPVVAKELHYRAEGVTARADEADGEDIQAALDDEAARLHARADALTREAQR